MTTLQELEAQQAREASALNMKQERERSLVSINFPKRKTGEMNSLAKLAATSSKALEAYDSEVEPPPLADLIRQTFNETIARLKMLTTPQDGHA